MRARDITSSPVVTVTPGTTVKNAADLLASNRFTALPVLNSAGRLAGVVTEADTVRDRFPHNVSALGGVQPLRPCAGQRVERQRDPAVGRDRTGVPEADRTTPHRAHRRSDATRLQPDAHILVAGGTDKTLRLWDVTDPAHPAPLAQTPTGHINAILTPAFSPDGRTLASGSADKTIQLWNVMEPIRPAPIAQPLTGDSDDVTSVTFSRDGRTLASDSNDETARLWDVADPARPVRIGSAPQRPHRSTAVSGDQPRRRSPGQRRRGRHDPTVEPRRAKRFSALTGHSHRSDSAVAGGGITRIPDDGGVTGLLIPATTQCHLQIEERPHHSQADPSSQRSFERCSSTCDSQAQRDLGGRADRNGIATFRTNPTSFLRDVAQNYRRDSICRFDEQKQ
jgi:hypothetical protein